MYYFQILDLWFQGLPLDFTVKNFADEVKVWTSKGYLDVGVWKHLQNFVTSDVLPSYSEMIHMRRSSQFGVLQYSVGFPAVSSDTIPGLTGKQILNKTQETFIHKPINTFESIFQSNALFFSCQN